VPRVTTSLASGGAVIASAATSRHPPAATEVAPQDTDRQVDPGDDELIRRAQRGEGDAYAMLVGRHQQVAFRAAYAVCGDAAEAEDAAQEAFVKAYGALGRFRAGAPWRPWLLRIVANEARNRRRSAGRREHLALRVAALAPEPAPAAEAAVLVRDERAALLAALGRLDPPHREVVVLRHLLDLSEAECAAVLGVRRGTVKSRLSRALAKLREDLGER
jgi:RNA polymerase sigma factor (sigma-70 family)